MRVIVNVYDIQKSCNAKGADRLGVGIYHSGVEVCGMEYAYGGNTTLRTTGVYQIEPRSHSSFEFKTSIDLGDIPADDFFQANNSGGHSQRTRAGSANNGRISFDRDVWPILEELMDKYRANQYDMLKQNCNHFSDEFVRRLFAGQRGLPNYINRAAYIGSFLHCLVPEKYLTVTPAGCEEEAARLAEEWKAEDEMEAAKQSERRRQNLEDMSTRETEMSAQQDGTGATPRSKASGSSRGKEGETGLIDSFYRSLTGRSSARSAAGDEDQEVAPGTDSGEEDEPESGDGLTDGLDEPGSEGSDEVDDSDADAQLSQASDQAQLVGGSTKGTDSVAQGSLKKRSNKKRQKE